MINDESVHMLLASMQIRCLPKYEYRGGSINLDCAEIFANHILSAHVELFSKGLTRLGNQRMPGT